MGSYHISGYPKIALLPFRLTITNDEVTPRSGLAIYAELPRAIGGSVRRMAKGTGLSGIKKVDGKIVKAIVKRHVGRFGYYSPNLTKRPEVC